MATIDDMTPLEIVQYYVNLLIIQYAGLPAASGIISASANQLLMPQTTVQTIAFSAVSTNGTFQISYNGNQSAAINWNDNLATVSSKIMAISGLSTVVVTGSIAGELLTVTFTGVPPVANSLLLYSNSLEDGSSAVEITIAETDVILPLAIQNAFNFIPGTGVATGVQLDVIGKYAGVTRSGFGFTTNITLDDADFTILIQMAISKNNSGSSLATIQQFLFTFFSGQIIVVDGKDMTLTYVVSSGSVSFDLIQLFITEGLLPKPMGVLLKYIIYVPTVNLFKFRTYEAPAVNGSPFNTYAAYNLNFPFLSYQDVI